MNRTTVLRFIGRRNLSDEQKEHQLGKRNVTPDEAAYHRGCIYNVEKKEPNRPEGKGVQNDPLKTADKLASELGVSPATIKRDAKFANAVDTLAKVKTFKCKVVQGTREDARWLSYSANRDHGLMRNNEDKQKSVLAALKHPKGAKLSDTKIAEHVGVDVKTVGKYRQQLVATMEIPESPDRIGRDGRTINTSNIGKSQRSEALARAAANGTKGSGVQENNSQNLRVHVDGIGEQGAGLRSGKIAGPLWTRPAGGDST